jgi:hypothetical protein
MAWSAGKPSSDSNIRDVPRETRENFQALSATLEKEHYGFSSSLSGRHIAGRVAAMAVSSYAVTSDIIPVSGALVEVEDKGVLLTYWDNSWQALGKDQWDRVRASLGTALDFTEGAITGAEVAKLVVFDTEQYDTLSSYNHTTGYFVPKTRGNYYFGICLSCTGASAITTPGTATSTILTAKCWYIDPTMYGKDEWRTSSATLTSKDNIFPSADGSYSGWSRSNPDKQAYELISDNDDSTYIYTSSTGSYYNFYFQTPTITSNVRPVSGVRVYVRARTTASTGYVRVGLIFGAGAYPTTTYWSDSILVTADWPVTTFPNYYWEYNPVTSGYWDSYHLCNIRGVAVCAEDFRTTGEMRVTRIRTNFCNYYDRSNADALGDGSDSTYMWVSTSSSWEDLYTSVYPVFDTVPPSARINYLTVEVTAKALSAVGYGWPRFGVSFGSGLSGTALTWATTIEFNTSIMNSVTWTSNTITSPYRVYSTQWVRDQISRSSNVTYPIYSARFWGSVYPGQGLSAAGAAIKAFYMPVPPWNGIELDILSADGSVKRYQMREFPGMSTDSQHYTTTLEAVALMCSSDSAIVCATKYGAHDSIEAGVNRSYIVIHRMGDPCF